MLRQLLFTDFYAQELDELADAAREFRWLKLLGLEGYHATVELS